MKGGLALVVLVVIVAAVGYVLFGGSEPQGTPPPPPPAAPLVLPVLTDVDPEVRAALEEAFAAAQATPGQAELAHYARVLHAHGMYAEAEPVYIRAAEQEGPERLACTYLAAVCAEGADPERAAEIIGRALTLGDGDAVVHLRAAGIFESLGRLEGAAFHYRRAGEISPSSHADFGLGRVALGQERPEIAVKFLEKARRENPRHHEVATELARAYRQLGREEDARRAAAAVRPDASRTHQEDPYLDAVLTEGRSFLTYLARGKRAAERGDDARALELFDAALSKRPDALEALLPRAVVLNQMKRWDACLDAVRHVLRLKPGDPAALTLAGDCHWNLGDLEAAERSFKAALLVHPDHKLARYKLALTIAPFRREEAQEILEPLVRENPDWPDAHVLLGKVYKALGEKEKAREQFGTALVLDPRHAEALRMLAALEAD